MQENDNKASLSLEALITHTEESLEKTIEKTSLPLVEMIAQETLIQQNDLKLLTESKGFIVDAYKSVPMYRPLVIKLFGVLNNSEFPTADSKFWQCKVEAEVHANELIKDLHDLELQKIQIERAQYLLQKILAKSEEEKDPETKLQVGFDIREQRILISRKQFDMLQLQKRIKYRIEEVVQWRQISEKLIKSSDFKNINYAEMLAESLVNKWQQKIQDPALTQNEKSGLNNQIAMMKKLSEDIKIR